MKVLQIRGCNASGKTTCVNGFIKTKNLTLEDYFVDNKNVYITTNENHSIIVLGRYDKKIGGCDLFGGTAIVIKTILKVIKDFAPKLIIFEGMIYSKSVIFTQKLQKLLKSFGYKYQSVYLYRTFNNTKELLDKRSGGGYSIENLLSTYKTCINVYKKIKQLGFNIKRIDVDSLTLEETEKLLLEFEDD